MLIYYIFYNKQTLRTVCFFYLVKFIIDIEEEQEKLSDIEQQPPFGDRK